MTSSTTPKPEDAIRKAVIDTGPLFSALTLHYAFREEDFGRSPRLNLGLEEPLLTKSAQLAFLDLMRSIPDKLTTSHAVAELHNLERSRLKLYGPALEIFWRTSVSLLRDWNLDERLVQLLEIAAQQGLAPLIPDIGLVDTGLIELARRNECVLITQDERTLARRAWELGVDCRLVKQLISIA